MCTLSVPLGFVASSFSFLPVRFYLWFPCWGHRFTTEDDDNDHHRLSARRKLASVSLVMNPLLFFSSPLRASAAMVVVHDRGSRALCYIPSRVDKLPGGWLGLRGVIICPLIKRMSGVSERSFTWSGEPSGSGRETMALEARTILAWRGQLERRVLISGLSLAVMAQLLFSSESCAA